MSKPSETLSRYHATLEAFLEEKRREDGVPGLSVAVVKENRLVWARRFGIGEWLALDSVERGLGGTDEITGGLWVLLVSWAALRAGGLCRTLNYFGVVVGVGSIFTIAPGLDLLGIVFGLGVIVWLVWLGIVMLRGSWVTTHAPNGAS